MDGILLFNKPLLWTSHDAVDFVRRRLGQRSVGHAGTLDPLATGLLVVLLGKATKFSRELSGSDKEYAGSMTLGLRTDTQDLEGRIISETDPPPMEPEAVQKILSGMIGVQTQVPPRFSAVKKKGKSLYRWAREGVIVEAEARQIHIIQFEMTAIILPEVYFMIHCSKGTYVRTVCETAGERIGCGGVLSSLVRTRSGHFSLEEAISAAEITALSLSDIEDRLAKNADESLQRI